MHTALKFKKQKETVKGTIMKKHIALILGLALIISMTGCGKAAAETSNPTSDTAVTTQTKDIPENTQAAEATPTPEPTVAISDAKVGDAVSFGIYEQDNDTSTSEEPIVWRVLAIEGTQMLLISKDGLDDQRYNEKGSGVTWENCSLRTWLNDTFLNAAFSADEQEAVVLTTITNPDNPDYGTAGCPDTQDKVFVLSIDEYIYHREKGTMVDSTLTEYAKAQGVNVNDDGTNHKFWLRSPGSYNGQAACASNITIDTSGLLKRSERNSVRPVIYLDLTSEIFVSEAA